MKIDKFLNPKYIAIIGASSDSTKVGRRIFDNLILNKKSKVFPINNKEKRIAGSLAYQDISSLPIKDWNNLLVVIAIPAKFVLNEIIKGAKIGVKNFIIISAGFKEIGGLGVEMEEDIIKLAQKEKLNILGPNCLGFINGKTSLNATFSNFSPDKKIVRKNNIAFLSQSGAIGSAVLDWVVNKNIGLSYFISLGNKASLNENDFFEYFYRDKNTDLIVAYLEEISQGPRFLEMVSKISKIKPVAILKSGKTEAGSKMASSHTGSLAGSHKTTLLALEKSGAIILENINELYNLMRLVKGPIKNDSGKLAIISNAGGPAVLATDEVSLQNMPLANFSGETKNNLKKYLPVFANIKNPLDILGDAGPDRYVQSLRAILKDKSVSSILILLTPQSMTQVEATAEMIGKIKSEYQKKNIVTCFMGGVEIAKGKKILAKYLVPNFDSLEEAICILNKLDKYKNNRKKIKKYVIPFEANKVFSKNPGVADYLKSFQLLRDFNIESIATRKIEWKNIESEKLKKIKYPIAIKFVGPDFLHKTDKQAVFLNVKKESEALLILKDFKNRVLRKIISNENYIVYQPMSDNKLELILGMKKDPIFGPVILLGWGGIYAEVYKDIVMDLANINKNDIRKMISNLKIYPILKGARGQRGVNMEKLVETIFNFSRIVASYKDISEIDINPLFVDEKSVLAADIRIITS
ncbi:MAG TPA: acetate--CoA ligase family protein [bacterium]|nr:acetate--CoA ligase family protein [bacterium]